MISSVDRLTSRYTSDFISEPRARTAENNQSARVRQIASRNFTSKIPPAHLPKNRKPARKVHLQRIFRNRTVNSEASSTSSRERGLNRLVGENYLFQRYFAEFNDD